MKKIFPLLLTIVFVVGLYSYTWDANVISACLFENNGNSDTGSYNALAQGTPLFSNSIFQSGAYSYYHTGDSTTNYFKLSTTMQDYLYNGGTAKAWTIEAYVYCTQYNSNWFLCRGDTQNVNGNMLFYISSGGIWVVKHVAPSVTDINFAVDQADYVNKWAHIAVTNNNTLLKVYVNNVEKASRSDGNVFAYNAQQGSGLMTYIYGAWSAPTNYMDNLIISDIARTSFPTDPLAETPTITQTVTETVTQTITPTVTKTVTKTATQTITQTVTKTVTETVTQTVTKTVTKTITETITPSVTPTVTETVTQTITPTVTQTGTETVTQTVTQTITPTYTITQPPSVSHWRKATNDGTFDIRDKFGCQEFDSKVFIFGGTLNDAPAYHNVWSSANGIDWTEETDSELWLSRFYMATASFDSKLWAIGGRTQISPDYESNEVYSSANGVDWNYTTGNAEFSARHFIGGQSAVVYDSKLWIVGGESGTVYMGTWYDDVWYTTDGAAWTRAVEHAAFGQRIGQCVTVFQDKIWVIGGVDGSVYPSTGFSDAWYSTNGADWTVATKNAGFTGDDYNTVYSTTDYMYLYSQTTREMWQTADGVKWTRINMARPPARRESGGIVFLDKLWLFGGYVGETDNSEIWYSTPPFKNKIYNDPARQPWEW